jgi:hypothetical protein
VELEKDRPRGARRDRTRRYAKRAQRLHLRYVHPSGQVDCICEQSVWYFAKAKAFFCRRVNFKGRPKIAGLGCGPDCGLRRRIKERIQGKRLVREWVARLGANEPEDVDL